LHLERVTSVKFYVITLYSYLDHIKQNQQNQQLKEEETKIWLTDIVRVFPASVVLADTCCWCSTDVVARGHAGLSWWSTAVGHAWLTLMSVDDAVVTSRRLFHVTWHTHAISSPSLDLY